MGDHVSAFYKQVTSLLSSETGKGIFISSHTMAKTCHRIEKRQWGSLIIWKNIHNWPMGRELDRKKNKVWLPNDTVRVLFWGSSIIWKNIHNWPMGRELDRKKNKVWLPNDTVRVLFRSITFQIDSILHESSPFAFNTKPFSSLFLTVHNSFWL